MSSAIATPTDPVVVYLPEGMRPVRARGPRLRRHARARAGAAPVARVRRLDRRGLDRERAVGCVARGRGAVGTRPRRREPRLRRVGARRDRVRRSSSPRSTPTSSRSRTAPTAGAASRSRPRCSASRRAPSSPSSAPATRTRRSSSPARSCAPTPRPRRTTSGPRSTTCASPWRRSYASASPDGDERIALVEGRDLLGADDLPDGIHPGDHGHAVLAAAFGDAIAAALANTRQ